MAAAIEEAFPALGRVSLISGHRGEFSVLYNEQRIAQKTIDGFPTPEHVLDALRHALM